MIFVKIRILFGTMKHVLLPLVAASALLITACQSRPIPVSEGRCEQVPDMRSSYSSGAHPRGTS
ncbi:hypothetical protein FFW94_22650 [Escherichia coli]|nr:hypothetical protein [Escherichia coli]